MGLGVSFFSLFVIHCCISNEVQNICKNSQYIAQLINQAKNIHILPKRSAESTCRSFSCTYNHSIKPLPFNRFVLFRLASEEFRPADCKQADLGKLGPVVAVAMEGINLEHILQDNSGIKAYLVRHLRYRLKEYQVMSASILLNQSQVFPPQY